MHIHLVLTDLTESAFLAARATAHATRLNVSTFAHSALCGCQRRDAFCARCDRSDFESPETTLVFTGSDFVCCDCLDESAAAQ